MLQQAMAGNLDQHSMETAATTLVLAYADALTLLGHAVDGAFTSVAGKATAILPRGCTSTRSSYAAAAAVAVAATLTVTEELHADHMPLYLRALHAAKLPPQLLAAVTEVIGALVQHSDKALEAALRALEVDDSLRCLAIEKLTPATAADLTATHCGATLRILQVAADRFGPRAETVLSESVTGIGRVFIALLTGLRDQLKNYYDDSAPASVAQRVEGVEEKGRRVTPPVPTLSAEVRRGGGSSATLAVGDVAVVAVQQSPPILQAPALLRVASSSSTAPTGAARVSHSRKESLLHILDACDIMFEGLTAAVAQSSVHARFTAAFLPDVVVLVDQLPSIETLNSIPRAALALIKACVNMRQGTQEEVAKSIIKGFASGSPHFVSR